MRSQPPRALRQPARRRVYPLVILAVVGLALVAAIAGFEYYYHDRVYPNVYVTPPNIPVGGQTQAQIAANLQAFGVSQRYRTITLRAPDHTPFLVTADKLGYTFDTGLTAWRAMRTGRNGSIPQRAMFQLGLLTHRYDMPAVQRVDKIALRDFLFKLSGAINRKPGPGVTGYQLDVAPAQKHITRALLATGPATVSLTVTTQAALPKPKPAPPAHQTHGKKTTVHKKSTAQTAHKG